LFINLPLFKNTKKYFQNIVLKEGTLKGIINYQNLLIIIKT